MAENYEIKVTGNQEFMGQNIPVVLGGFGDGKKCISDKTIADIHGVGMFKIRERIQNNIRRFKENVDFIDLKRCILRTDTSSGDVDEVCSTELLSNLGYAKQSITQATHIYVLSERGYAKLIKIMDTDLAWDIHDKLMDEYYSNNTFSNKSDNVNDKGTIIHNCNNEIVLQNRNGEILVSSRDIAEKFGKEHDKVRRDIKYLLNFQPTKLAGEFLESEYTSNRGKTYNEYLMTRDGFSLLCMGFTGSKALEWKLKFIEAFNKMEEALKSGEYLSEKEKLKLQLFSKNPLDVASAYNKLVEMEVETATLPLKETITEKEAVITEQQPLVEAADRLMNVDDAVDISTFAKIVSKKGIKMGMYRMFEWLRKNKYLMTDNIPYQKYVDNGYFQVINKVMEAFSGSKTTSDKVSRIVYKQTYITSKGQVGILKKLQKEFN